MQCTIQVPLIGVEDQCRGVPRTDLDQPAGTLRTQDRLKDDAVSEAEEVIVEVVAVPLSGVLDQISVLGKRCNVAEEAQLFLLGQIDFRELVRNGKDAVLPG